MFKFSPRRNGRYRGLKHLGNKKAVFEESTKVSEKLRNGNGIINLGRKYSPQLEEMSIEDERQKEEEEADNQLYGEESKNEEGQSKGEGKESGDDEMHKHDLASQDGGHRVDFVDGEKETEENRENVILEKGEENIKKESKKEGEDHKEREGEKKSEIQENEQSKEKESEESTEKKSGQEKDDRGTESGEREREGRNAKDKNENEGHVTRKGKARRKRMKVSLKT